MMAASASASASGSSGSGAGAGAGAGPSAGVSAPASSPSIHALPPDVVSRIAAGEVIHRPSSALKELLENSIDAGATRVAVTLRDGGLHTLHIVDNGCGIRVDDFPILCERFTTSKLSDYSDLAQLGTFGFRGEALSSITHVARVSITSMTRGATCAYKANFSDGKMVAAEGSAAAAGAADAAASAAAAGPVAPKPCAGVQGTVIHVEDLFYNVPIRRQALRNTHSEEYARCLDMMCKYAIHYSARVSMSCKKQGQSKLDLNTPLHASVTDNIRAIYGAHIARELLPLEVMLDADACAARGIDSSRVHVRGWVSNANFSQKRLQLLLFINARLVDSSSIRRVLDTLYARVLPKHAHPFVYLSLDMDPRILDVNVHPTKKEVHFLHEEQILHVIEEGVEGVLKGANKSRVFYTQSITAGGGGGAAAGGGMVATRAGLEAEAAATAARRTHTPSAAGNAAMELDEARAEHEEKQYVAASSTAAAAVPAAPTAMERAAPPSLSTSSPPPLSASSPSPRLSQSSLPSAYRPAVPPSPPAFSALRSLSSVPLQPARRDSHLVRTDNRQGKMDMFFAHTSTAEQHAAAAGGATDKGRKRAHAQMDTKEEQQEAQGEEGAPAAAAGPIPASSYPTASLSRRARPPVTILLTSVHNLLAAVSADSHPQLHELLSHHTFVGFINPAYSLVQFRTRLYLLNITHLSRHFFYQTLLRYFGHHPVMHFARPLPLRRLIRMALDHPSQASRSKPEEREAKADEYTRVLVERAAMLKEYFAVEIGVGGGAGGEGADGVSEEEEGQEDPASLAPPLSGARLLGLPELAERYNPPMLLLPLFLLRLARDCDWSSEQECFESVARCVAEFYRVRREKVYLDDQQPAHTAVAARSDAEADADAASASASASGSGSGSGLPPLSWWVAHVLLPGLRHRASFDPPAVAATDGTVTQVAALENLYKIFERC